MTPNTDKHLQQIIQGFVCLYMPVYFCLKNADIYIDYHQEDFLIIDS